MQDRAGATGTHGGPDLGGEPGGRLRVGQPPLAAEDRDRRLSFQVAGPWWQIGESRADDSDVPSSTSQLAQARVPPRPPASSPPVPGALRGAPSPAAPRPPRHPP